MLKSIKKNTIILLTAFSLLVTVLLNYPSASVQAKEHATSQVNQKVTSVLNDIEDSEIDKANSFVKSALKKDFSIDEAKAFEIGYTQEQINDLKVFFGLLSSDQVAFLKQENNVASFVPAIPLFIGLTELLALLTALGLAGIAQQFLKEVYKHGMASACRKFAKKSKHLENFCKDNGYPTS